jgi:uncharacterized protein YidB (DUF937 family)
VSLFGGILGNVVGSVFGSNPRGAEFNSLGEILTAIGCTVPYHRGLYLTAALTFVRDNGGLDGMLATLRSNGLGEQADSWVGPAANVPISQADLVRVFGEAGFDTIAAPLNISADEMSEAIAEILPELVHQLTPGGRLPENHAELIAKGLAMLNAAST